MVHFRQLRPVAAHQHQLRRREAHSHRSPQGRPGMAQAPRLGHRSRRRRHLRERRKGHPRRRRRHQPPPLQVTVAQAFLPVCLSCHPTELNSQFMLRTISLSLLLLSAASAQPVEKGKFILHKFFRAIGEETYEIARDGDSLVTKSTFAFTDRGAKVPLTATLRTSSDLTPQHFEIKGQTSRISRIDTSVDIAQNQATIRENKDTRTAAAPARFFTIAGYAPATVQMLLLRY